MAGSPWNWLPFESPAEADTVSIPPRPSTECTQVEVCVSRRGEDLIENVCSVSDTAKHSHLKTALKERYKSILFQAEQKVECVNRIIMTEELKGCLTA